MYYPSTILAPVGQKGATRYQSNANGYTRSLGSFPLQSYLTMCAFIRMTTDRNAVSTILTLQGSGSDAIALQTASDGTNLEGLWSESTGPSNGNTASVINLTTNTWTFVAITMRGTLMSIYGVLLSGGAPMAVQTTTTSALVYTNNKFQVGRTDAAGEFFNGRICGVKIWSRPLDAGELEYERRQFTPYSKLNLFNFYPLMNQGSRTLDFARINQPLVAGTATFEDGPPVPWELARPTMISRNVKVAAATGSTWPGYYSSRGMWF